MKVNHLIVYRGLLQDEVFRGVADLLEASGTEALDAELFCKSLGTLLERAGALGLSGNLWRAYLTYLLIRDENAFSLSCEFHKNGNKSFYAAALSDFAILREVFHFDWEKAAQSCGINYKFMSTDYVNNNLDENTETSQSAMQADPFVCGLDTDAIHKILRLSDDLEKAESAEAFADMVAAYYAEHGAGQFGLHKAFKIRHHQGDADIVPILNTDSVRLEDLVGYELQKKKLRDNTEAFVRKRSANNCLLFGAAGTGKSSSIKGILNEYADRGLRMIELYKHELKDLGSVMARIRNRNYRFIIYMDDLSFEDFETEYKYLKAVIEGGLEKRPENVLIYATSNRRHLIRESFSDREEGENDLHRNDTVQEKLSLAYRFGVSIYFGSPDKKEFNHIVKILAKRYNMDIPESELLLEANKWELSHGGLSGRTAQAFIDYMRGTYEG